MHSRVGYDVHHACEPAETACGHQGRENGLRPRVRTPVWELNRGLAPDRALLGLCVSSNLRIFSYTPPYVERRVLLACRVVMAASSASERRGHAHVIHLIFSNYAIHLYITLNSEPVDEVTFSDQPRTDHTLLGRKITHITTKRTGSN